MKKKHWVDWLMGTIWDYLCVENDRMAEYFARILASYIVSQGNSMPRGLSRIQVADWLIQLDLA